MENAAVELHPVVRALVVAALIAVPILLVILPRLGEIREILKRPRGETASKLDVQWPFANGAHKDVLICPKCFRQNPPGNRYCGYCGCEIILPKKEG